MQRTLSITVNKKTITSKPFDFEAMCIINDAHNDEKAKGPLSMCREAVDYMFEGTEATQEIINSLSVEEHTSLCLTLWRMYMDAITSKNA
ncbi:hypothetical protein FMM68_09720 [Lachnospiraceae bacterium MD329]|nr:hypothetical protein [Lachnospiraceae bacterium MD329]